MPEVEELLSFRMSTQELAKANKDFCKLTDELRGDKVNHKKNRREARKLTDKKRRAFMHS